MTRFPTPTGRLRPRLWLTLAAALALGAFAGDADAQEWGRFYHYPHSYFPQNFRESFESSDFPTPYGYPAYPQRYAFPPFFRKDLYYPYLKVNRPGGIAPYHGYHQGNHYILDVF